MEKRQLCPKSRDSKLKHKRLEKSGYPLVVRFVLGSSILVSRLILNINSSNKTISFVYVDQSYDMMKGREDNCRLLIGAVEMF